MAKTVGREQQPSVGPDDNSYTRLEKAIRLFEESHPDLEDCDMGSGIDYRDLKLILAVAYANIGDGKTYLSMATETVESWVQAAGRQRASIDRLLSERRKIAEALGNNSIGSIETREQIKAILHG